MRGRVAIRKIAYPPSRYHYLPSCHWQWTRRNFCAPPTSSSTASSSPTNHLPPLAVRLALVGSSVGLSTPVFVAAGAVRLWSHHVTKTSEGRLLKTVVGFVIGGGTLKVMYEYVIPFLGQHSDLVAPFALANAITSAFWYGVGEAAFGMKFITSRLDTSFIRAYVPGGKTISTWIRFGPGMAGPVVGGLTTISAPFLWSTMYDLCWSSEMKKLVFNENPNAFFDFYSQLLIPVGLPVGVLAGMTTHSLLESLVVGKQGIPWQSRSLPILIGILSSAALYFGYCYTPYEEFLWIRRYHPKTGNFQSYNPRTKQFSEDLKKYQVALAKRVSFQTFQFFQSPFNYIFGKSEENLSKDIHNTDKYEKGKIICTSQIGSYNDMIQLIDILLRYRYLKDESHRTGDYDLSQEKIVLEAKAKSLGVQSLDNLYSSVELMVIIKRRLQICKTHKETIHLEKKLQEVINMMRNSYPEPDISLWDSLFPPFTNHEINTRRQKEYNIKNGRQEIRTLQDNIDVFENELLDILGIKVDDSVYDKWIKDKGINVPRASSVVVTVALVILVGIFRT